MMVRNDDMQITFEVVLRKEKYDAILHNFYTDGNDYNIREDFPLSEELVDAPEEVILKEVWEETISFWTMANRSSADKCDDMEKKEALLAVADALETLDYEKVQKKLTHEKIS